MRAQTQLMILLAAFLSASSNAYALDCEALGEAEDNVICSSIPEEAPETLRKTRSSTSDVDTSQGQFVSMLTNSETSGETDVDLDKMQTAEDLENIEVGSSALAAAESVQNQLRSIEVFLKSGAAANGNLTVISAGSKKD